MKGTLERELKLRVAPGFQLPELGGEPLESRVFVSTYYDTDDFRLAGVGVTLRHRVENGLGLWQLKLPRGAARIELELPGGAITPPAEHLRLLPALLCRREIGPVARLRTRRAGVRVRDNGRPLADVTVDSVSLLDGQRVTLTFEELEVELLEGDERALRRIERSLRAVGAGDEELRSKLVQALRLDVPARVGGDPSSTLGVIQAMLAVQLGRILDHDPGTRLGTDPEDLHQLRVASRRLRAFLCAARPLLQGGWGKELRSELGWLGGALGPVRDLDVMLDHLREESAGLDAKDRDAFAPLLARLEAEREAARETMLEALDSERYLDLLDRLQQAAENPRATGDAALTGLWRAEFRRLRRAVGALGASPSDEELHETRIRAKRARYAAELAQPELGKRGTRFVQNAKRLQDLLGEHQDAFVAEERIRTMLESSQAPSAHFAAGRLVERQRSRRRLAREGFGAAWERLEQSGQKAAKR
ncbi:CYTH and CHAD domain-containing protein [soil metagenome]